MTERNNFFKVNAVPKLILLVEDNELNRLMFQEYLVVFGYQVLCLTNGFGFFQTLSDFQPHLILLDLKLPNIDGDTLLEQIQQSLNWQRIPVIVVSGLDLTADRERAMSLGVSRYFVKPVDLSQLKQAIQDELNGLTA